MSRKIVTTIALNPETKEEIMKEAVLLSSLLGFKITPSELIRKIIDSRKETKVYEKIKNN